MFCKICKGESVLFLDNMYDDRHGYDDYFSLYRCGHCGFIQTVPEIDDGHIQELYSRYYPRDTFNVDEIVNTVYKLPSRFKIYLSGMSSGCHFLCEPGKRVLDIGCGRCDSIRYLLLKGCDAYGVEPDMNINPIIDRLGLKVKVGLLDVNEYKKGFFDIITMSQVLEHVSDPVAYIKRLRRILSGHGKIIMSFPNAGSLLAKVTGRRWVNYHIPYHINHFNRKSVEILAEKAGYIIENIRYVTPNRWLGYQIYHLFFRAKKGEKNPFWSRTGESRIIEKPFLLLIGAFEWVWFTGLPARLLDMFRQGESLVVTLRNKK